jgi:hypothetical protein
MFVDNRPSIWALWYQCNGIATVAPWYYIVSFYYSNNTTYFWQTSRAVPVTVARYLLPAVIFGYLAPTILMFLTYRDTMVHQGWIAFWQLAPLYPSIITGVLSMTSAKTRRSAIATSSVYRNADLTYLKNMYFVLFLVTAGLHLVTILLCCFHGSFSLTAFMMPNAVTGGSTALSDITFTLFKHDFIIYALSSLVWCIYSTWDLHRVGLSYVSPLKSTFAATVLFFLAGPGAMQAAVGYWREVSMASLSRSGSLRSIRLKEE